MRKVDCSTAKEVENMGRAIGEEIEAKETAVELQK